jgi:hypothetical protein
MNVDLYALSPDPYALSPDPYALSPDPYALSPDPYARTQYEESNGKTRSFKFSGRPSRLPAFP